MSLASFIPTVKTEFDPTFKATGSGGMTLWSQCARKLGLFRTVSNNLPDGPQQTLAVQLAAGLSLGGHGQAAAELVEEDTKLQPILGIEKAVGKKRINPTLVALAGCKERKRNDAYRVVPSSSKGRPVRWQRVVQAPEPATPESLARLRSVNFDVLSRAIKLTPSGELQLGGFYCGFLDGSLLETDAKTCELAAKDRNGKLSVLFVGFWLGPYLLAADLFPGNTEEGTVALRLLERGLNTLDRLGIPRKKFLLLADSAYGQGHILEALAQSGIRYIVGMNRHRKYLTKKAGEFSDSYWSDSASPSRGNRLEKFSVFYYQGQDWKSKVEVMAVRYAAQDEVVLNDSFLTSNLTVREEKSLPQSCLGDSLLSSIWRTYARKQQCENHQKDLFIDLGLHHPSSSRACIIQVLYEIGNLALNIGVFVSRAILKDDFHKARLWRIARTLYSIPGLVSQHGRTLSVRLSTAPILAIQTAWKAAMEALARI